MMSPKNVILQAYVEDMLTDLMVKTNVENVVITEANVEKTLATKLSEMITTLNAKATKIEVTTAISTAIDELISGAPGTYDTLKEIADYITSNQDVVAALNSAISSKVDKIAGMGLSSNDFTDALLAKINSLGTLSAKSVVVETDLDTALKSKINASSSASHSHANKTVLDGVSSVKIAQWDKAQPNVIESVKVNNVVQPISSKGVNLNVPNIYTQVSTPPTLKAGDLFLKIVE